MKKHHVPGFSVAVVSDGKIYADGYGLALLPDVKVTEDTLFPMCSTSKSFTAGLLGILIADAQSQNDSRRNKYPGLSMLKAKGWLTSVCEILPKDFVTTSPFLTKHLTLQDLACHRSGIAGHDFLFGPWQGTELASSARNLRHLEPASETEEAFRAKFQYNNMMYGVLGQVIEVVTGQRFHEALQERVFAPLDMSDTSMGIERAQVEVDAKDSRWSRPYYFRDNTPEKDDDSADDAKDEDVKETGLYYPSHWTTLRGVDPAGAIISNAQDYAKWIRALLEAAKPSDEESKTPASKPDGQTQPAKPANKSTNPITTPLFRTLTTALMPMPTVTIQPSPLFKAIPNAHALPIGYALGWYCDPHVLPGEIMISHGGGLPGVGTLIAFLPNHDFGIVLAGNSNNANLLIEAVSKELFGRRIGWSMEKRRKHHADETKAKAKEAAKLAKQSAAEDLPGPGPGGAKSTTAAAVTDDVTGTFDNVNAVGKYSHPAYGTFVISTKSSTSSLAEKHPALHDRDIIRVKDAKDSSTNKSKSTASPLVVKPLGRRGLVYRFLLHPCAGPALAEKNVLPLTVEALISHGEFSECAFPDLAHGWGDSRDEACPGPEVAQRKGIWEAAPLKVGGGVLEFAQEPQAEGKRWVKRLGLRLARIEDPPDDEEDEGIDREGEKKKEETKEKKEKPALEEGWENRMVWFTRVLEE